MSSFSPVIALSALHGRRSESPMFTDANGNGFLALLDDMGAVCVSGALAFSAAATPAVPKAACTVTLTADGTHTPTVTGFTQARYSGVWNTAAGTLNQLTFWCDQTGKLWYSITPGMGAADSGAAPAFGSLSVTHGTNPTIALTLAGNALNTGIVPPAGAFTVRDGNVALAVGTPAIASSTQVNIPVTGTVAQGDTLHVSYGPCLPNALQDPNANLLAMILDAPVTAT